MEKTQLKVEDARMEAALATLKQEEVAAVLTEAEILESAAAQLESKADSKEMDIAVPHDSAEKRTSDYVECHSKMLSSQQSLPHLETRISPNFQPNVSCAAPHQDTNQQSIHTGGDGLAARSNTHPMNRSATQRRPSIHPHSFSTRKGPPPLTPSPWMQQATQSSAHDHGTVSEFAIYMARRELVASGMIKFDDLPENYWSWKSTFMNIIQGLKLTCTEELDLLIKWLGPQSSEHVKRIRAVHVNDPAAGLNMAWTRLEECYGSPEQN